MHFDAFISYVLWSRCLTLSQFYMVAIVTGISMSGLTLIPVSLLITNWFVEKRGLAMGIVFAGSGIGGMVFSPITNWIIINHGWQSAYLSLGIIMLVLDLPVILILIRATPGEKGASPYGLEPAKDADVLQHDLTGLTVVEAIKTGSFWLLGLGLLLLSFMNMGVLQHIPAFLTDLGYTSTFASSVVAIIMAVLVVGKVLLGGIFDRWGSKTGMIYACSVFILALVVLLKVKILVMVFVFAVFFGLGNALTTVPSAFLTAEIFGKKNYGVIYGLMNVFITLGMAAGPPLSGAIYDSGGSYTNAWILYMGVAVLAALSTIGAVSINRGSSEKNMGYRSAG